MSGTVTSKPRARPRTTLLGARIRANPALTRIAFSALSDEERSGFGSLANDPTLHGVVRDGHGAVKVADHDTARLLDSLREPRRVEGELAEDEVGLVRLVLDGLLEVETASGDFVSGSRAFEAVCGGFSLPAPTTKTARLSRMALQHAQSSEMEARCGSRCGFISTGGSRPPLAGSRAMPHADRSSASCRSNRAGRWRGGCGERGKSSTSPRRMTGGFSWRSRQPPNNKRNDQ